MSLRFIHGKPGSGKSCYCVSLIVKMLSDWARYKIKEGEAYPRTLFTNIPLHVEEVNRYLSAEIGRPVDVSEHIELLEEEFFRDSHGGFRDWWEDFPEKSFVVIDEVQFHLPASLKRRTKGHEHSDKMMEFVSTHRHKQMDLILMSQHIDNISVEVKRQIETSYEVLNVKSGSVGIWPFVFPMADIDVVRESWGLPVQMAHIRRDVHESKRKTPDKNFEVFVLTPALFKLYRSHTKSTESLDRPSLRLGRVGSLVWFARRHVFRIGFWTIMLVCGILGVRNVMSELPHSLVEGMLSKQRVPSTVRGVPLSSVSAIPEPVPAVHVHGPGCNHDSAAISSTTVPPSSMDDKILGFVRGGVITPKGVLRKDDHIIVDGEKDFVSAVDVGRGILYLGSGKKVQK